MNVTLFTDLAATTARALDMTFGELVERIGEPKQYSAKADCPLVVLGEFGSRTTDKGSLRWAGNILSVHGIEGDYDAGVVLLEDAAEKLRAAGVKAVLYTSPSHTPERPRWRVLAPLSHKYLPRERERFVARINGVLGGILAPESFRLGQSYYIGRVAGATYDWACTDGECIDLLDELDAIAIGAPTNGASRAERIDELHSTDPVVARLLERGLVRNQRPDGTVVITCPFEAEHTTPGGADATVYFPAHTGGYATGTFHCKHSHCASRKQREFREAIGMDKANDEPIFETPEPISQCEWDAARLTADCIVEDLLFADVGVLNAPGGSGKTTLLLHIAVCVCLGRDVLGLKVRKPGVVVFITAEDERERMVARLREVCVGLGLSEADKAVVRRDVRISDVSGRGLKLTFVADDVVTTSGNVDLIAQALRDIKPVLVVFDPTVSFGCGESRVNDAEQGLIEAARRLRNELRCCVAYVHHTGKQNARDKTTDQYSGRGGSALPDGSRMTLVMTSLSPEEWRKATGSDLYDGEAGILLSRPKLTFCPQKDGILIRRRGFVFERAWPAETTAAARQDAVDRQVLARIASECSQGRYPTKDWLESAASEMDLSRAQIRDAVNRLLHNNLIERAVRERVEGDKGGSNSYLRPVEQLSPKSGDPDGDYPPEAKNSGEVVAEKTAEVGYRRPIGKTTAATTRAVVCPSALVVAETTTATTGDNGDYPTDVEDLTMNDAPQQDGDTPPEHLSDAHYAEVLEAQRLAHQWRVAGVIDQWRAEGVFGQPRRTAEDADLLASGIYETTGEIVGHEAGLSEAATAEMIAFGRDAPREMMADWRALAERIAAERANGEAK